MEALHPPAAGAVCRLDFAASGNAGEYCLSGWSLQEPRHRWMTGPRSLLALPPVQGRCGTLYLKLSPFGDRQRLALRIDGEPWTECVVDHAAWYGFEWPAHVRPAPKGHLLELLHPDCGRTDDAAGFRDTRELALCVRELLVMP